MLPSDKMQLQFDVWIYLWHVLPETWTELEELMQKEEIQNSPNMSKDGWKCSTPRLLEVVSFQWVKKLTLIGNLGCQQIHLWFIAMLMWFLRYTSKKMPFWNNLPCSRYSSFTLRWVGMYPRISVLRKWTWHMIIMFITDGMYFFLDDLVDQLMHA